MYNIHQFTTEGVRVYHVCVMELELGVVVGGASDTYNLSMDVDSWLLTPKWQRRKFDYGCRTWTP